MHAWKRNALFVNKNTFLLVPCRVSAILLSMTYLDIRTLGVLTVYLRLNSF